MLHQLRTYIINRHQPAPHLRSPSFMSASHGVAVLLLLLVVAAPAVLEAAGDDGTTHLHFFMHDIVSGSNPTAVQVIKGPGSSPTAPTLGMSFGDTSVIDDPLTETSSSTATPIGRMQGLYMLSAQSGAVLMVTANILLTSGEYNGSTIAVMGRDDTTADVRELSVVGGTGKFRMANGYVLWKTTAMNGPDATVELDVYLAKANGTTVDASTPLSPVDGSSSSGSGLSSGSSMMALSAGWVVAIVAAVVGSCWVW